MDGRHVGFWPGFPLICVAKQGLLDCGLCLHPVTEDRRGRILCFCIREDRQTGGTGDPIWEEVRHNQGIAMNYAALCNGSVHTCICEYSTLMQSEYTLDSYQSSNTVCICRDCTAAACAACTKLATMQLLQNSAGGKGGLREATPAPVAAQATPPPVYEGRSFPDTVRHSVSGRTRALVGFVRSGAGRGRRLEGALGGIPSAREANARGGSARGASVGASARGPRSECERSECEKSECVGLPREKDWKGGTWPALTF